MKQKPENEKGEEDEKFDQLRAETVRRMAGALADEDTNPGEHCLGIAFSLNHTLGGVEALIDPLAGPPNEPPAGSGKPEAVVFMPEEGHAELILQREPHLWLPEDLTPEEQETVDAYAHAAAPAVIRTLRASKTKG